MTRFSKLKTALAIALVFALPGAAGAGLVTSFDEPDTVYTTNVVIDIIEHNGGVWFATGEGLNFSFDDGETWLLYDAGNGLVSSSISSMFSIPGRGASGRLWIGTTHEERISGDLYEISDGVSYTDDNGSVWTQIDFDSTGLNIPFVTGGFRTVYDITGHYDAADPTDDWVFFSAFAAGFMASRDGGNTWRRIYASRADSVQFNTESTPSLRNRYFSCSADSSHGDSLFVWAGTAEGFFQYIFAPPDEKAYVENISTIVFCDTCGEDDSNFVYFGGDAGFMRSAKEGGPFISRFEEHGLPGQSVSALVDFGGKLFVGTIDPIDSSSTGLAESDDFGDSFTTSTSFSETGPSKRILDFAAMGDRLYMAAEEAGLYVTRDTGQTWTPVVVDAPDLAAGNRRNVVHALNAWGDTLRLGTDSGFVNLFMDPLGVIDSSHFFVFEESEFSSSQVVRLKTQRFAGSDVIWTINRPMTAQGMPIVGRSPDGGESFASMQVGVITYDVNFFGDTAFVTGEEGIRFSIDGSNPGEIPGGIYYVREFEGDVAVDSLIGEAITVMEVLGDTIYIGSDSGFAVSVDRGETYDVRRINNDPLKADLVLQYTYLVEGVTGNWIPALEVQYLTDTLARVWTSNRRVESGSEGISVGRIDLATRIIVDTLTDDTIIDSAYIYNWDAVYSDFAWNFAFNGDTTFAATNGGLIFTDSTRMYDGEWDTLEFVNEDGIPLLLPGSPVYAVQVVGDYIWAGTGDRTVRISLNDFTDQRRVAVIDEADEAYAFPVPFSHSLDQAVEFHFIVREDADVTVEIYDFAMNLVRRVIDNEFFPAGVSTERPQRSYWDGLNGRGDPVAVGVYYFKVEFSTGEVQWGKLAVIP